MSFLDPPLDMRKSNFPDLLTTENVYESHKVDRGKVKDDGVRIDKYELDSDTSHIK